MGYGNYRILYEKDDVTYKLCRVSFSRDGSYFVTSPYHPFDKAALVKLTVNYALQHTIIAMEDAVDLASLDDDRNRLKLSHHVSGLVQFSGQGITSGVDEEGNIKGMGVQSWPLYAPMGGPAFGLTIRGVEQFERHDGSPGQACIFRHNELTTVPGADCIHLEGHYFPASWYRFLRTEADGSRSISVLHPAGVIVHLRTIFAGAGCDLPGFIGLELYTSASNTEDNEVGFTLGGSTGNLRENEEGQTLADGIHCIYPRGEMSTRRILNYTSPTVEPRPVILG